MGETDAILVIFDAAHGVLTKHAIKVRDQVRNPISVDATAVMTGMARRRRTCFSIAYDVRFAHRQVPVEESEWGRLGCQIERTAAEWMRSQISAAIAMPAEICVVEGPRPRTRLGTSSPIRPSQIEFSREQLEEKIWGLASKSGQFRQTRNSQLGWPQSCWSRR